MSEGWEIPWTLPKTHQLIWEISQPYLGRHSSQLGSFVSAYLAVKRLRATVCQKLKTVKGVAGVARKIVGGWKCTPRQCFENHRSFERHIAMRSSSLRGASQVLGRQRLHVFQQSRPFASYQPAVRRKR